MPAATIAMLNSVSAPQAGIASSTLNISRQLGSLISVAVFGNILNASAQFIAGIHLTLIIGKKVFYSVALLH